MKAAAAAWWADRAMSMAASISFYATFSLAPMLLLVIAVAGLAFGEEAARGAIVGQIGGLVGSEGAGALEQMVQSAADAGTGIVSIVVGIATVLLLSTGALVELQDSLNVIWRVKPPAERSGLVNFLRTRLLSLALILTIGFLLLVSFVFDAALGALGDALAAAFPGAAALLAGLNLLLFLCFASALVAAIYKILPAAPIAWRDVWFGAAITAALLAIGKFVIGVYIGAIGLASAYGAAASIISILLWVYYSALILLFGAELTKVHAEARRPPLIAGD